jgi:hypothetical protein
LSPGTGGEVEDSANRAALSIDALSIDGERSERRVEPFAPPRVDRDRSLCKQPLERPHDLVGLFRVELEPGLRHDVNLAPGAPGGLTASIPRSGHSFEGRTATELDPSNE